MDNYDNQKDLHKLKQQNDQSSSWVRSAPLEVKSEKL